MRTVADLQDRITFLETTIKQLELEIELKDDVHCQELRRMRNHLETVMNKYCLD